MKTPEGSEKKVVPISVAQLFFVPNSDRSYFEFSVIFRPQFCRQLFVDLNSNDNWFLSYIITNKHTCDDNSLETSIQEYLFVIM